MSKKINVDEIDESFIVAAVRKERITQAIVPPPLTPLPATIPAPTEDAATEEKPHMPEPLREEGKRKRNKPDYEALFIRESNVTARLGKTVYIRKEFHDRIQKIVQVIRGNEVSLFSYIDNLIAHHFEMFQDDIIELYWQRNNHSIF
jgi:hypothetical protein